MADVINNNDIRANNARKILFTLRAEPLTKKEIAEKLELSLPTVNNICNILQSNGYIEECGSATSSVGRKPALITLAKSSWYAIGIHVQTYSVKIAVADFGGNIILQDYKELTYEGTGVYWNLLAEYTEELIETLHLDRSKVIGIKIAIPGIFFPKYWNELRIEDSSENVLSPPEVKELFHFPTEIISVANAAGIRRIWYGSVENDTIVIELSRFIDGCLIHRDPISGIMDVQSLDIGHISVNKDGAPCFCGKRGCLQTYCSPAVITDMINRIDTSRKIVPKLHGRKLLEWSEFVDLMEKGNEEYKRLFEEFLNTLAYLISNLRTTFTTDIVVCGDIATTIEKYKPQLVNKIDAVALAWKNPESASTFFHANSFERYQASVGAALSLFDDLIETL